jgi:hypothetical protein
LPVDLRRLTLRHPAGRLHAGYTHRLNARLFALCRRLECLSVDGEADEDIDNVYYDEQRRLASYQLFDGPIVRHVLLHVLPPSLTRLRLPARYSHEVDALALPAQCEIWKGNRRMHATEAM